MKYYHDYSLLPDHIKSGFENYIIHGLKPGRFVTTLLANDLFLAVRYADSINLPEIHNIAWWIIDYIPEQSYGSYESVENWCKNIGNIRTKYIEELNKELFWKTMGQNI